MDYALTATPTRWIFNFVKLSLQIFINLTLTPTLLVIDSVGVLFPQQVDKSKIEMTQQPQRIKTNIKFQKNEKGAAYGFVTKNDKGSWRGCRESEGNKKIVFVDRYEEANIIPGALYTVSLIPMASGNGFIALNARLMQFEANIETTVHDNMYRITVQFGQKTIVYDPTSSNPKKNNIQAIVKLLKSRVDLKYKDAVADEFCDCACLLLSIYKRKDK